MSKRRPEPLGPMERLAARLGCETYDLSGLPSASITAMLDLLLSEPVELPPLTSGTIQAYVAAVAQAVQSARLSAARGRSLLYAAQLMISARR